MENNLEELIKRRSKQIKDYIIAQLVFIGENPTRKGLISTPDRVVKMYEEIFRGYDKNQKPKITVFPNGQDGIQHKEMVIDKGYFFSMCEHHMIPFFGEYYFGYIPNKKIVGISKIARLVDWYASKLQVQERLTKEIVDDLEKILQPRGIMLVLKGRHLCKEMRGVKKFNSPMTTSEVRGVFDKDFNTRQEFLKLIDL